MFETGTAENPIGKRIRIIDQWSNESNDLLWALLDFVTTHGQETNSHKFQYVKELDKNMTLGIGKAVTESNMSQNQIVTKSNNACNSFFRTLILKSQI